MRRALGLSPHTGWAAAVVVGGSLKKPIIAANELIEILGDAERFCFHMAEPTVPVHLVAPRSLDASTVGKLAGPPWGKDQKLAALAAWSALRST